METGKERAIAAKTLVCFLQSLIGQRARVELKDDHQAVGTIRQVDGYMNVEMVDVTFKKPVDLKNGEYESMKHDYMMIKGPRIRYVALPEEVDVLSHINQRLDNIKARKKGVNSTIIQKRSHKR